MPEIDTRIMRILHDYFDNDIGKVSAWINTPNPLLGDVTPCEMIVNGKQEKLLIWMRQQEDLNVKETP